MSRNPPSRSSRPITRTPSTAVRRFVAWTVRHGVGLWLAALALTVPATIRTATMYGHLRSDIEALLPSDAPSVQAIDELRRRMPGLQFLGVVVDTGTEANLAAGEHFLDDLAARVRAYPHDMVRSVRTGSDVEREFVEKNAALYVETNDLEATRRRIEARRDHDIAAALGTSLDDDAPAPAVNLSDLAAPYREKAAQGRGSLKGDRFSSAEQHTTLLVMEAGSFSTGDSHKALLRRVQDDVASLGGPQRYAPGMRLGYSGDVAISVEEVTALVSDLSVSSVVVVLAVIVAIVVYYRWWPSVVVLVAPLIIATLFSFALASLPPFGVTELNSNTAFLGSIIVGNGINFGIILLARYVEERRRGTPVRDALDIAVWAARPGTLSAALAAGASYAALVITEFRGFRQFGIIGGIGMVMSWFVAFLLMPPLIAWLDRSGRTFPQRSSEGIVARVTPLLSRFAVPITAAFVLLTAAAGWSARRFDTTRIEYDFSRLRRADTWTTGEGYWGGKMDALLGQYLSPTAILAETPEQARTITAAARGRLLDPSFRDMVTTIRSADDVLPLDQTRKVEIARAIARDLTPRVRASLAPDDAKEVERLVGRTDLRPVIVEDLPSTFTEAMLETDGTFGRTVLVYPRPNRGLWEGPLLLGFVEALRSIASAGSPPAREPARVAGSLPLSADIVAALQRDGLRTSVAAFLGVVAVVVIIFRGHRTTLFVLGALVVGVLYLFAGAMALSIKVNFCNFIAFPITFGIGVDYSVNVMSRYVQDGEVDPIDAVRSSGGAVALCSLTTIIGYSSLLLAQNRALYLFGLLAVLGEVACLLTALVVLPAALVTFRSFRAPRATTSP